MAIDTNVGGTLVRLDTPPSSHPPTGTNFRNQYTSLSFKRSRPTRPWSGSARC